MDSKEINQRQIRVFSPAIPNVMGTTSVALEK